MLDKIARNLKDYGIWLVLKIFLEISVFSFNTRKKASKFYNEVVRPHVRARNDHEPQITICRLVILEVSKYSVLPFSCFDFSLISDQSED